MANTKREVTVVTSDDKKMTIEEKISLKELEEQYNKMVLDRDNKCKAAKEQLVEMLKVTVDKYRTATGTAEALRTLRFVTGDDAHVNPTWANKLAWDMSVEASKMSQKAEGLGYAEMDKLCEGFYDQEFQITAGNEYQDLAFEMMRIDLCRNVGGAAEDMVSFINRVQEELNEIDKAINELKSEELKEEE